MIKGFNMEKIYERPVTSAVELKLCGMLCASGLDGDFSGESATENAKAPFLDDWIVEE